MKVAISSSGKDLDSQVDPRFGRCVYFVLVDTDDMNIEVFDNKSNSLGGGAGIQSAQLVASTGAKAVITGNCGPNAVKALNAAGIDLFVGQTGTIREAVENFKKGLLTPTNQANVPEYSGMGQANPVAGTQAQPFGGRKGGGRGMGGGGRKGGGRGMGGGRAMGRV